MQAQARERGRTLMYDAQEQQQQLQQPPSQHKEGALLFALKELNQFPFSVAFMHQSITFIGKTESILMLTLMNRGAFAFARSCPLFLFIPSGYLSL